jgi:cation diffusion facilitator CzcD-associated flavoprotein CzcO
MYTLGYAFKPWEDAKAIADGPAIRNYIRETAREHGIEAAIRFHHRVVSAEWNTELACWTVHVERADTGARLALTCDFLHVCSGYYDYEEPFRPEFGEVEQFAGEVIHPQHWPQDFDYAGKRVLVIGSGATAVTLVPAMADTAAHVTMLQRSPSYVVSLPARDPVADLLRARLPARAAYALVRWKNVLVAMAFFQLSRRRPRLIKKLIRRGVERHLPAGFDVERHFTPRYNPWDQRVCFVPDADLFAAIGAGRAEILTDTIAAFTEQGVKLASGRELEADVIVTATGLNIKLLGGMTLTVDGLQLDFAQTVAYKGMMFSGVPNLTMAFGYTNASWTLKCDLVNDYLCRLINHMDARGYRQCLPLEPGPDVAREPLLDLRSGYVARALERMPKQGSRLPWRLHQNYALDLRMLRYGPLEDEGVQFSTPASVAEPALELAA